MSLSKIENPDLFRANIRKKLIEKLDDERAANNLEKGIFNYTLKEADQRKVVKKWDNKHFVQIYIDRLRSIVVNLKGEILEHIKDGTIKPHVVAFMTHQELAPEKWATLIDAKTKRDKNKFDRSLITKQNLLAILLCLILILLAIFTADSSPTWIYQGF